VAGVGGESAHADRLHARRQRYRPLPRAHADAQGIEGGKGKLEGNVSWSGPPYAMDIPTLSGRLALSATKGRFVKVDPGIGKLLVGAEPADAA
jgi:uncharacterized protein YhdP